MLNNDYFLKFKFIMSIQTNSIQNSVPRASMNHRLLYQNYSHCYLIDLRKNIQNSKSLQTFGDPQS